MYVKLVIYVASRGSSYIILVNISFFIKLFNHNLDVFFSPLSLIKGGGDHLEGCRNRRHAWNGGVEHQEGGREGRASGGTHPANVPFYSLPLALSLLLTNATS